MIATLAADQGGDRNQAATAADDEVSCGHHRKGHQQSEPSGVPERPADSREREMYSPATPVAVFTPPTVAADAKTRDARSRPRPAAESHRDETMPGNAVQRSQQDRDVGLNVRPSRCGTGSL